MRKKVGIIHLGDKAYLSDPCYGHTCWCNTFIDTIEGQYRVYITRSKDEFGMVTNLVAIHEDYYKRNFKLPKNDCENIWCGVDSGTCGIFDYEYFRSTRGDNDVDDDWYQENVIGMGLYNITDDKGVISCSGFGDGTYPVFAEYNKDKQAYAIRICFRR